MVRSEHPCHEATARDVPDDDSEPREKEAQDGLAESQVSCRKGERVYDWQPKRPGDSRQSGQDETLQRNLESIEGVAERSVRCAHNDSQGRLLTMSRGHLGRNASCQSSREA
jgi:hypothetical protein